MQKWLLGYENCRVTNMSFCHDSNLTNLQVNFNIGYVEMLMYEYIMQAISATVCRSLSFCHVRLKFALCTLSWARHFLAFNTGTVMINGALYRGSFSWPMVHQRTIAVAESVKNLWCFFIFIYLTRLMRYKNSRRVPRTNRDQVSENFIWVFRTMNCDNITVTTTFINNLIFT